MPQPGFRWYHTIFTTHGSWLHGDPRGFRSRDHRIHSSGDYKHRPPPEEHEKLHRYHVHRSKGAVMIPRRLLSVIGERLHKKIAKQGFEVLAISVAPTHVHVLAQLPDEYRGAKRIAGMWKQATSHAIRETIPGQVWAEGGKPIEVNTVDHQREVYQYILDHAVKEGAWVWSYRMRDGGRSGA